jgi:K+-sensing histidine kinase KdpD
MRRWFEALDRNSIAVACGLAVPVGVAAALVPFRSDFAAPAAALVLVLVVVAVACFGNRFAGALAALSAAAWFDFFLTRPYGQFAITHRPDIETTVCLFVVGLAVTEIAARSRGHRQVATEESHYVALVHDFAEMAATGEPAQFLIARAAAELTQLLGLKDCRFETQMSKRHPARIEHSGVVALGGLRWAVNRSGLPGREVELVVRHQGETYGRFVMVPTPGSPVSTERLLVAASLADQVGAALANQERSA